ncbi:flavodoxin family protein [Limosilactobacillus sp.]|uniref:flavodoxin family protein n=1 Tax=Limosilactobacillus sp. TaxID=2773925 RepID=UPI00345EBFCF
MKKVVIITGTPHPHGSSLDLADAFEDASKKAGNDVYRFDAGLRQDEMNFLKLDANETTIHDDDVISREVMPKMIDADVMVLVTSLYYYGINAELKAVIDRFYEHNHDLKDKQSAVLISGYGVGDAYDSMKLYFKQLQKYMRWEDLGLVLGEDSWNSRKHAAAIKEAAELGAKIK